MYNDKGVNSSRRYNDCNIYTFIITAPKYIKQIVTHLKAEIDSNATIVGGVNLPFQPWIDHPDRQSKWNTGLELHFRPDGPSRHLQNTPSNSNGTHTSPVQMKRSPG